MLDSSGNAGIRAFMTNAMKDDLRACGFTEEQLAELTPQEGEEILAAANIVVPDSQEVHKFIEIVVAKARAATKHLKEPGVLQITLIHPLTENVEIIYRYALDLPKLVERMTSEAVGASAAGHNVYIEARTVRRGLAPKERGNAEDTVAVLALVVDSDADKNEAWTPNVPVSLGVETSPGNAHSWLLCERALDFRTGRALGADLRAATKTDKPTGNITQPYRIAGTVNYPNDKKKARGRVAVGTRIVSFDPKVLWTPEQFEQAFPSSDDDSPHDQAGDLQAPIERIAKALSVIPHNDKDLHNADYWKEIGQEPGRSYMILIGLATKGASGGSAEGFELFDNWRKGAPDYKPAVVKKKWKGFHPTKIGFGTLKFYADKARPGWEDGGDPLLAAEVERLAKLSNLVDYERERKFVAKKLGISVSLLNRLVAQKRKPTPGDGGLEDKVALQFSEKYKDKARYVHLWGKWFAWNSIRWVAEETLQAFDRARELCRAAKNADHKTVAAVIGLVRTDRRQAATTSQWDADPWLLGTPKGTVDLRTGKLSPPKSADYITKITSVAPSDAPPRDSCLMFLTFLNRVTNGDEKLQDYLQRVCGYCLTGDTTEDALFFHYGKGGNGKSVFFGTISGILNDYHEAANMDLFVVTHGEKHPTDLASLRGARLVTAVETDEGKRWAEAKLCQMTGGDPIKARFMRQDFFTYIPQFKLQFAGNHKPAIRNVTKAMARRFHLIPWLVTIPESEVVKSLSDDLKVEWPGILRWMIDGCLMWQRDGLNPPKIVRDATKDYLESEDTMQNFFEDCCVVGKNMYDSLEHLWDGYVDWCEDCREFIGTKKAFGQKLKDRGYESRPYTSSRTLHYFGIRCIRENRKKTAEELKQKMEEERLRQAAAGKSGTVPQSTATTLKSKAPSFTSGRACEMHTWSLNWISEQEAANRTFGITDLETELRIILREELPANEVEAAIKQVMDLVLGV